MKIKQPATVVSPKGRRSYTPTVPFAEQIFQVAVMLREGDTSPTDIPKFFGARTEMEALSANGGVVGSFSAACKPNIMQ